MGNAMSRKKPLIIGECTMPAYVVKTVGSRHFLIAGGGGGAKTGVRNEIDLFLLTYNQLAQESGYAFGKLQAKQTVTINTAEFSNMNMDVMLLSAPQHGKYLVAVGQDSCCALYESVGFCLSEGGDETSSARLSLQFCGVCRWQSDFSSRDPYQSCVKLYRCGFDQVSPFRVATGGVDGQVRVWNASVLLTIHSKGADEFCQYDFDESQLALARLAVADVQPEFEINARGDLADGELSALDVAASGEVLATVVGKVATLWETRRGQKLITVPVIPHLAGAEVRALKFLNLDKSGRNEIFACAYNKRLNTRNSVSYLALFAYEKKRVNCHLISVEKACTEAISCLAASDGGDFLAVGTMDGDVGVFDTHNLRKPLYFAKRCHSMFVTSVEFLPQRSYDSCEWGRISPANSISADVPRKENNGLPAGQCFLPGVCSGEARAAVISLSVDNRIQVHQVCHQPRTTLFGVLFRLLMASSLLYLILWFLFLY